MKHIRTKPNPLPAADFFTPAVRRLLALLIPIGLSLCSCVASAPKSATTSTPPIPTHANFTDAIAAPVNPNALSQLPAQIERDLREGNIPGAVVSIGRPDQVLFQQAFGDRALLPVRERMTTDTIFDLASLTKVICTTTAVLQLVEQNQLALDTPVAHYWPEFANNGKGAVTLRHLLTHYSGLRPDISMYPAWHGYQSALRLIEKEKLAQAPGTAYVYSDINFEVLGELVRRTSGTGLASYCKQHIFIPLHMRQTRFRPPASWRAQIAPTEWDKQAQLRGEVHDPAAQRMGGIAGHAGLFSTVADLSRFARMLLNHGELDGVRILQPQSVQWLFTPQSPEGKERLRGLGWDLAAPFAPNRLALPTLGAFGHTGYTGTSLWIDPIHQLYSIILSNRVHPDDRAKISNLRDDVATTLGDALAPVSEKNIANALAVSTHSAVHLLNVHSTISTGIDVLENQRFASLAGKRIGLITNQSGRDHDGNTTVDLFRKTKSLKLVALFSPEHGLDGTQDIRIDSSTDNASKLPVYSLYGKTLRPTPAMLKGIDVLVFDIQDAGARFYTFISTLGYAMEAAAAAGIDFYVLDRPNPIGAHRVQGPLLDADLKSFTGYFSLPVSHGMTTGELARLFNRENAINARLRVIPMQGYHRDLWFDQTGLDWINPSPNLRSLTAAALYPGVAIVEGANVSVGRGTSKPFELMGAPWIDGVTLSRYLHKRNIRGVDFKAVKFTPASSLYQGKRCHGVKFIITDREALDAPLLGVEIASALQRLYPQQFDLKGITGMIGSRAVVEAIRRNDDPSAIAKSWEGNLKNFVQMREKYLLY